MIRIIDQFGVGTNLPIDSRMVFGTPADAIAGIPETTRYVGLIVSILNDGTGKQKLFWFKDGTTDANFVELSGGSGTNGQSAFEIWKDVTDNPTATEEDFLDSLKGDDGTSITILGSYDTETELTTAHPTGAAGDGYLVGGDLYVWSEDSTSWVNVGTIQGPKGNTGNTGKSAFEVWKDANGKPPETTEAEFILAITGPQGSQGKSAYEVWSETNVGTADQYLASLKGKSAYEIWLAAGNTGTEADFLNALKGADGTNGATGKSAYQIWLDNGGAGSEAVFLASLKGSNGADGDDGADGKSAYEVWLITNPGKTEAEFFASLKGAKGNDGTSITILGSYASYSELVAAHPTGNPGDGYIISSNLWVWSASSGSWQDVGQIKGPQGEPGNDGSDGAQGETGETGPKGDSAEVYLSTEPLNETIGSTKTIALSSLTLQVAGVAGYNISSSVFDADGNEGVLVSKTESNAVVRTLSLTAGDVSVEYENADPVPVAIGGIADGSTFADGTTVQDVLTKLLYPYTRPVVSISGSPSNSGVRELGVDVSITGITINVTKKSNNIASVVLKKGATVLETFTSPGPGTFNSTVSLGTINSTTTFSGVANDGDNDVQANLTYNFALPVYYGTLTAAQLSGDPNNITEAQVLALTKEPMFEATKGIVYANAGYYVYAIPIGWGPLTSILDPNNFENLGGYNVLTKLLDVNANKLGESYRIYIKQSPSSFANYKMTYIPG